MNDASAMLLYQAPSGITVFSFDGGYLNDPVKDFWACLPPLSLKLSMKYEKVPTPIDLVNEAIDGCLGTRLTELCGSEKKLVVGSAEHERIIEKKLAIIRSLKNPMQSVKINDALAMLLYQAPSGIAIFCFDGSYLNDSVEDFWACLPQLTLIVFIKKEKMPIPINPYTEVIDGRLVKLRKLCDSGRKLVVGSAEYKRIVETKLGITCLHVDVPDCEVIICSRNKPALLPEKQSEPAKDLELFLHQHGLDVNLKMVDETSLKQAAYLLHDTELCEKEYLKFFRLLLKDFMVTSEIDTNRWVLIHFATALKMICYPGASYEVYHPVKLFLFGEVRKIEAHASGYRRSFSRIDVLPVYEHVVSLDSKKCVLMFKLDVRIMKAKKVLEDADVTLSKDHSSGKHYRTDFRTGSKVGREASSNVDGKHNSITQDSCIEVNNLVNHDHSSRKHYRTDFRTGSKVGREASSNVDGKHNSITQDSCTEVNNLVNRVYLDFSCERQALPESNSCMEKPNSLCNEEICNKENAPGQQAMSNQTILAGGLGVTSDFLPVVYFH